MEPSLRPQGYLSLGEMAQVVSMLNSGEIVTATPAFRGKIVPVAKKITLGGRGGAYYVNAKGKKVYLKRYQKRQCIKGGGVEGDDLGLCRSVTAHTGDMSAAALEKMGGIPKYAKLFLDPNKHGAQ